MSSSRQFCRTKGDTNEIEFSHSNFPNQSSTLKAIVTSRQLLIERKGIDARRAPNYVHLLIASNSDWVVPASPDERRYFVLEVPPKHKDDHEYFGGLEADWLHGAREAFLHYLQNVDISKFNVRRYPETKALFEQKLLSLGAVDRWYLEALRAGTFSDTSRWPDWKTTKELYESFAEHCRSENLRSAPREAFGMRLVQLVPPRDGNKSPRCQRQRDGAGREWGYQFADLSTCRQLFCKVIGYDIEWETPGEVPILPGMRY